MRLAGALLLVAASTLLGMAMGRWYTQRASQLRDLLLALEVLETEIRYGAVHLSEALRRAGSTVEPPVRDFFLSVAEGLDGHPALSGAEAWERGLARTAHRLSLDREEKAALRAVGVRLGASDADDQVRYLQAARHVLRRHAEKAEGQRDQGVRLWRYLGVCTGLALVLLLY